MEIELMVIGGGGPVLLDGRDNTKNGCFLICIEFARQDLIADFNNNILDGETPDRSSVPNLAIEFARQHYIADLHSLEGLKCPIDHWHHFLLFSAVLKLFECWILFFFFSSFAWKVRLT